MNIQVFVLMLRASLLAMMLFNAGCDQTQDPAMEKAFEEKAGQLKELEAKRDNRIKQLKMMDISQLARELEADSEKGFEPFNSMSFAELISRGEDAGSKLKPLLTQADHKSLLGLLALMKVNVKQYQLLDPAFRVRVLTDALRTSKYFNKWGLPHLYWEDAAKAIIAEGKAAEQPLIELLMDTRPAPMWGSDEVVEYKKYNYRVRDYAWAMLNEIRGRKGEIPTNPLERDKLTGEVSK